MSDIGNGRTGRADVVIVGGGSAGAVLASSSERRSDPLGSAARGRHGLRRRRLSGRPTGRRARAGEPRARVGLHGARWSRLPADRRRRAPRCSAAARPTTPRWRCAHGRATSAIGSVMALTSGRSRTSTPPTGRWRTRLTATTPTTDARDRSRSASQKYDDLTTSLRGFVDATAAEGFPRGRRLQRAGSERRRRLPGQRHRRRASEHRPRLSHRGGPQPPQPQDLRRRARRSRPLRRAPGDRRRHGKRRSRFPRAR